MTWTPEADARLRKFIDDGLSATQIAARMCVTRNAVIGRAHRRGLHLNGRPVKSAPVVRKRKDNGLAGRVRLKLRRRQEPSRPSPLKAPAELPPLEPPLMLSLVDLGAEQCKWPFGDPAEETFGFCGHRRADDSPYCPHHAELSKPKRQTEETENAKGNHAAAV